MFLIEGLFIFFHFPKTAGTMIRSNFSTVECIGNTRHVGINNLPKEYHGYPMMGCIRNPYDFYVSFYTPFRNRKLNPRTTDVLFSNTFQNDEHINLSLDNLDEIKSDFNKHLSNLLKNDRDHKIPIKDYDCGLATRLHQFIYGAEYRIDVFKFEELEKVNDYLDTLGLDRINLSKK